MRSLADLRPGQQAEVCSITGDDSIAARLMEMGVVPGSLAKFIGTAPLGDPMEFEIRHYRLSLRREEARRVEIAETSAST